MQPASEPSTLAKGRPVSGPSSLLDRQPASSLSERVNRGQGSGLSSLAYRVPGRRLTLKELSAAGLLSSEASFLGDIGFAYAHLSDDPIYELVRQCAEEVLAQSAVSPDEIGCIFWYSGLTRFDSENAGRDDVLKRFRYPVARIQEALDLSQSLGMAVSEQGCSGLLSCIHLADHLLRSMPRKAILCIAGDALPPDGSREILYNLMSDAASAVLVERGAAKNRILHFGQRAMPVYWDTPAHASEMLASYFPHAQRLILQSLEDAGLSLNDVAWIVPHNVSARSWDILAKLLDFPPSRIWARNIRRLGHTISCDHLINLRDMEDESILQKGDILLLFTFGFGATWTTMILQH